MSGLLRNIERGRENVQRRTIECVACGRMRRPEQVWRHSDHLDDYVCIDEAQCIEVSRNRLGAQP